MATWDQQWPCDKQQYRMVCLKFITFYYIILIIKIVEYRSRYRHYPFNLDRHTQIIQIHAQKIFTMWVLTASHDMCKSFCYVTNMECVFIFEHLWRQNCEKAKIIKTIALKQNHHLSSSHHDVMSLRQPITSRFSKQKNGMIL